MALFRFYSEQPEKFIELSYEGMNYTKAPIAVILTQKTGEGEFSILEELGEINFDKEKAKTGYVFKSKLGEVMIKWVTKFLIISEIQITLNGQRLKGGEIMNFEGVQTGKFT